MQMSESRRISFLGLGVMGGPIAGHIAAAGHKVTVYNRTVDRAKRWVAEQAANGCDVAMAETPGEAAMGADVVFACVGNDDDIAQVAFGPHGALDAMPENALFVDHTTISPAMARKISEAAKERNILALDAPVSGGQAGAESGQLAIMCGGSATAMAAAEPIMDAYAARMVHVGDAGAGQAAKAVNQICIAGVLAGLSEAVRFAQAMELDQDKLLDAISGGAAQSWQMVNRWQAMANGEFDFGFAVDWMRKDLAIVLSEANRVGQTLPVTALVDQFYAEVQAMGGQRQDTSALIRRLPKGTKK